MVTAQRCATSYARNPFSEYKLQHDPIFGQDGIGNAVIQREERVAEGEVCCRERPGGLLKHYYRAA